MGEHAELLTVQHQITKGRIGGEFRDSYGVTPEHKFSIPGRVCPAPEPYHFWGRAQCGGEFVEIRVGG